MNAVLASDEHHAPLVLPRHEPLSLHKDISPSSRCFTLSRHLTHTHRTPCKCSFEFRCHMLQPPLLLQPGRPQASFFCVTIKRAPGKKASEGWTSPSSISAFASKTSSLRRSIPHRSFYRAPILKLVDDGLGDVGGLGVACRKTSLAIQG